MVRAVIVSSGSDIWYVQCFCNLCGVAVGCAAEVAWLQSMVLCCLMLTTQGYLYYCFGQ
jgi:hypothetical protein